MRGGDGIDQFDGGEGFDAARVGELVAKEGAIVDLRTGQVENDGFGNRETLISIEGVSGSSLADRFFGSKAANSFGITGGDFVQGFGGDDFFYVNDAAGATLDGGSGSDTAYLYGITFRPGKDGKLETIYGDDGIVVSLPSGSISNDGFGGAASLTKIENVFTGPRNDIVRGDARDNFIYGGDGDDRLSGGAGSDTIVGGSGFDRMTGGNGADVFAFGIFYESLFSGEDPYIDVILDFSPGDKLKIMPDKFPLRFYGTEDTGAALAIFYEIRDGDTFVSARSLLPTGHIEFTLKLVGEHALTADDFVGLAGSQSMALPLPFAPFPPDSVAL